jgi:N-acetylglutamate synthase-like GNAT family acetyltransferase
MPKIKTQMRDFESADLLSALAIMQKAMNIGRNIDTTIAAIKDLEGGLSQQAKDYAYLRRKVITHKKKVVAICGVYRLNTHPTGILGICWFAVDPQYQRIGIGTQCMKWSIDMTRETGSRLLFVWSSGKAVPFYSKFGFIRSSLKLSPKESSILMIKEAE